MPSWLARTAALLTLAWFSAIAHAEEPVRPFDVVELFTSQGCSSCPPADAVFAELAQSGDVIALAYHVDYWDYLGWRDTLANPKNSARQFAYMRAFSSRSVYTPQAVVNGRYHVNGADRKSLKRVRSATASPRVGVRVRRAGNQMIVDADAGKTHGEARLLLVYFSGPQAVEIRDGKNDGRTLTYWNAVSDVQSAGYWHGEAARFDVPLDEIVQDGGCAVLLQAIRNGLPGPILGAAVLRAQR